MEPRHATKRSGLFPLEIVKWSPTLEGVGERKARQSRKPPQEVQRPYPRMQSLCLT